MGRRVQKTVYAYGAGTWQVQKEVLFVYDGWNVAQEITREGGSNTSRYFVWGLDLSQSLQGAGGVSGLLAVVDGSLTYQYFCDANGNVGQVLNAGDGSVAAHYEYDPFGNLVNQTGDYADENSYRFSTKYKDTETNLYYYGFRYYSTELGRWINRDPIGEKGGLNLHAFITNNGLNKFDLFGLAIEGGVNGTRAHQEFNKWLNRKRPGEFILDTPIKQTFPDIDSDLRPDVLYLKGGPKKMWVWDLKPFHPNGATPKEVRKVVDYIEALKTRCFKKGPPRFVVPVEHTYVGEIDDYYNPGIELKVYASPGYENGILTYTLEREDFDDDFWDRIKDVKPQDIPWFILLPIIILIPVGL